MDQLEFTPIRVMLASSDNQLIDNLKIQLVDAFPIQLVETVSSGQTCRSSLGDVAPDVLLLVDDLKDISALNLSREVSLAYRSMVTVLLSENTSPEFYQEVFQSGCRGVVQLTPSASGKNVSSIEKLINAITRAYEYLGIGTIRGTDSGALGVRIYTIFSAKGGVGKTLLAINLAAAAALVNPQLKVLYLDLNLQFGTSSAYLDLAEETSTAEIAPMAESLTHQAMLDMICHKQLEENCVLYTIPNPANPRDGEIVTEGHIRTLLASLKRSFDLIFIDTTSTVSDVTLPALQESHQILSVCLLDVMAVASLRTALDLFRDPDLNIPADRLGIVVNRVGKDANKGLVKVSHIEDLFDVPVLESIPEDPSWVESRVASSEFLVTGDWKQPFQNALLLLLDKLGLASE